MGLSKCESHRACQRCGTVKCFHVISCCLTEVTLCPPVSQSVSLTLCVVHLHRVVKEEISDDNAKLPCFNGRVVSWVSEMSAAATLSTLSFCLLGSLSCM